MCSSLKSCLNCREPDVNASVYNSVNSTQLTLHAYLENSEYSMTKAVFKTIK